MRTISKTAITTAILLLTMALFMLTTLVASNTEPQSTTTSEYEGFGANVGGTDGTVVHVTNTNDSGVGSLRDALSAGNRMIVFDVAGEIKLKSDITIRFPNITIDGTTAPSPGITLKNYGLKLDGTASPYVSNSDAHDIVIKGLRIRDAANDGISIGWGAHHIVIDHVSIANSGDGNLDITHGAHDITVSWSILGDTPNNKNMLIKTQLATAPRETNRVTLHHNLFTQSNFRNPRISNLNDATPATDTTADMRNNIVWAWANGLGTDVEEGAKANIVNNYYSSPDSNKMSDKQEAIVVRPEGHESGPAWAYVAGNYSADSLPFDLNTSANPNIGTPIPATPFPAPTVTTTDAVTAAQQVLAGAGVFPRDSVDLGYTNLITIP